MKRRLKPGSFFVCPKAVAARMSELSATEIRAIIGICSDSRLDNEKGLVVYKPMQLEKTCGFTSRSSFWCGLRGLEKRGLIRVEGARKGSRSGLKVSVPWEVLDSGGQTGPQSNVSGSELCALMDNLEAEDVRADGQPVRADGQPVRADGQPVRADGQPVRPGGQLAPPLSPPIGKLIKSRTTDAAVGAEVQDGIEGEASSDPVMNALVEAGINGRVREELATAYRGIVDAPRIIRTAALDRKDGLLVTHLRGLAEQYAARRLTRSAQGSAHPGVPNPPAAQKWQPQAIKAADPIKVEEAVKRYMATTFNGRDMSTRARRFGKMLEELGPIDAAIQDANLRHAVVKDLRLTPPRGGGA